MSKTILIENVRIDGVIQQLGDFGNNGTAAVMITSEGYGEDITLDISRDDAKALAPHLYETVYLVFDLKIKINPKDEQ